MGVLTVVLTVLTALLFLGAAWVKFSHDQHAMHTRDRLGIQPAAYTLIGVAEVTGAVGALVGLAVQPLGVLSLAGLTLLGVGACAAHVRLHDPLGEARAAILALALSLGALVLQLAA
jgi:hypothetical protein